MDKKFQEYKGLDLSQVNKDVLKEWKAQHTFEESLKIREGHPSFVFFEGPPSANGMPGIHHVMARTIKDIICRYKTLQGFLVERKAGWDTHGLPVELGVEKKLGITKENIGKTISVADYNKECRADVMKFTREWEDLTDKMGYWVNMEDPYITYLLPGGRNRVEHARTEPTGMLSGREGHHVRGTIQSGTGREIGKAVRT